MMPNLKFNYQGFKLIAQSTQNDLIEYLSPRILERYGKDNVDLNSDYLFARGDLPILLVAHLDTVHKSLPTKMYYDSDQGIIWSPQGIGGDDRCGVYGLLALSDYFYRNGGKMPSVLFTTFEETGCVGAGKASTKIQDSFISRIKYIIELDRRGENDCVFYQCGNTEFQKMVETYGFKTAIGSFSDIGKLCPSWDIAGVNLSSGYDNEHTTYETINVNWLMATLEKVITMISDVKTAKKYGYESKYSAAKNLWESSYTKRGKGTGRTSGKMALTLNDVYTNFDYKTKKNRYYMKTTHVEITAKQLAEMGLEDDDDDAIGSNWNWYSNK
jgi:hypothetical protein